MFALLFLIGSILFGIDIVKWAFPFTNRAERFFWGIALGPMATTWAAYLVSRATGSLSYATAIVLTLVVWGVVIAELYRTRQQLKWQTVSSEQIKRWKAEIVLALIFGTVFGYFFYRGMFHPRADGMFLTGTTFYDLPYHLALATSFLYGENFPPVNPVFPIAPLRYHFLPDFHATLLMQLGLGVWSTFALTSTIVALSFVGIFYWFTRRLTESKRAAIIATLLFFFSGGFGFLLFFSDWHASGQSFVQFFWNMKENYTDIWSRGIKWTNLMTSALIPQRSLLYGIAIALVVLTLIGIVWKNWSERKSASRWDGVGILLPAGIITGLLPLYHFHAYVVVLLVSCILGLLRPRLAWLGLLVPALLLGLPQWRDFSGQAVASLPLRYHLGWVSYTYRGPFLLFLLRNFGLPILLIFPAIFFAPKYLRTFYLPFAVMMVLCFVVLISRDDVDNTKLMFYWHAATAVVLGWWLATLTRYRYSRPIVPVIVLICTLSGFLSVVRESKIIYRIFSPSEIAAGEFVRTLPARSLFLTGPVHSQPALCLGGKPIVLGLEFLITSQGYPRSNYDAILADVKKIYAGNQQSAALLARYGVKYVYLSSYERNELKANATFFEQHYKTVFKNGEVSIYDCTAPRG